MRLLRSIHTGTRILLSVEQRLSLDRARWAVSLAALRFSALRTTSLMTRFFLRPLFPTLIAFLVLQLAHEPVASAQKSDDAAEIQAMMSPEEFRAAGLNKLSGPELAQLNRWLQGYRETTVKKAAARAEKTKMTLIVSRIDGEFNGLSGGTIIKLEDGTVWKQANPEDHPRGHADHPGVAIFKSVFGWKMRVGGIAEFYVLPVRN
jgi:hypothetical protein